MVVIRLARGGAKKRPFYHIVATDKRNPRDGRNIERLGYFNPIAVGKEIRLNMDIERVTYWLDQGAQPSDKVASLIKDAKKGPEIVAAERAKKAEKIKKRKEKAKEVKAAANSENNDKVASE